MLCKLQPEVEEINVNPVLNFFFALKAPESKRQYPKRFEKFLDYLKLEGPFEDKALSFYKKAIENPQWLTNKLVEFAQYQKQRAQKGEISESTIPNYFKAIKLFCVMNDIIDKLAETKQRNTKRKKCCRRQSTNN